MNERHDSASASLAQASGSAARPMDGDPLSDVLRTVRLTGALFFLWDVSWPYATPVPDGRAFAPIILPGAQQIISYHIVTAGSCWGALAGESPVYLEAGDILLVAHGDPYVISSSAQLCAEASPMEASLQFFRQMAAGELPTIIAEGGAGVQASHLVCGFLGCDIRPFNPVLGALPRLARVRPPRAPGPDRVRSLIDLALAEAKQQRPGGRCVLLRLSELLFIEVVRRCVADAPQATRGWLAGLRDPVVGRALMALHREPACPWTLEKLASAAGSSRSRLAESFSDLVGQPPMEYLAQWRLQMAARLLSDGSAKVAAIAREVGYDSEAAFSRAFKRFVGITPSQWRENARALLQM